MPGSALGGTQGRPDAEARNHNLVLQLQNREETSPKTSASSGRLASGKFVWASKAKAVEFDDPLLTPLLRTFENPPHPQESRHPRLCLSTLVGHTKELRYGLSCLSSPLMSSQTPGMSVARERLLLVFVALASASYYLPRSYSAENKLHRPSIMAYPLSNA